MGTPNSACNQQPRRFKGLKFIRQKILKGCGRSRKSWWDTDLLEQWIVWRILQVRNKMPADGRCWLERIPATNSSRKQKGKEEWKSYAKKAGKHADTFCHIIHPEPSYIFNSRAKVFWFSVAFLKTETPNTETCGKRVPPVQQRSRYEAAKITNWLNYSLAHTQNFCGRPF